MVKQLYSIFSEKWENGGNIWIYSDPHFNDEQMRYIRKNYIGDDEQIKRINSKVGKKDTIIFLGDIGDLEYVKKIKGYKVLVKGNHDTGTSNYLRYINKVETFDSSLMSKADSDLYIQLGINLLNDPEHASVWLAAAARIMKKYTKQQVEDNKLFDEVYDGVLVIGERLVLSHEPIDIKLTKDSISDQPFMLNIHGHDHSGEFKADPYHLNVCAECIDYTPVSLSKLIKEGILHDIESIHRLTIDRATEKKLSKAS